MQEFHGNSDSQIQSRRRAGRALRFVSVCAVALIAFAATVRAGEAVPPPKLPPFVAAHLSVKSPMALVEAVDRYAATATRGTANELPPGLVAMLAHFYSPAPLGSWDDDKELNVVFTQPEHGRGDLDMTAFFTVEDFPAFLEALESVDWLIGGEDPVAAPEEEETPVQPVVLPNGRAMVLVRYDGGLVALSENVALPERIRAASGWAPRHSSDADVALYMSSSEVRDAMTNAMRSNWKSAQVRLALGLTQVGVKPSVAVGALKAAEKYLVALIEELAAMGDARIELNVLEDRLLLDSSVFFPPGTLFGGIAARLAESGDVSSPLEKHVPASAVSYSVTAPLPAFLPAAKERFTAASREFFSQALPELSERAEKQVADFFAITMGPMTAANCRTDDRQYTMTMTETADAAAFMRCFIEGVDLFNEMLKLGATSPEHGIRLLRDEGSRDGIAYSVIRLDIANAGTRERIREALDKRSFSSGIAYDDVMALRFYAAALDGVFATGAGLLNEEDFCGFLKKLGGDGDAPFAQRPSVRALRGDLAGGQFSTGFVDVDEAFRTLLMQQLKDGGDDMPRRYREAVEGVMSLLGGKDAVLGAALGSADGWLRLRLAVPASGANAVVRNYETLVRLTTAATLLDEPLEEGSPFDDGGQMGDDEEDGETDDGDDSEEGVIGPEDDVARESRDGPAS